MTAAFCVESEILRCRKIGEIGGFMRAGMQMRGRTRARNGRNGHSTTTEHDTIIIKTTEEKQGG
ncbi:MAG: hypothetical protein IJD91_01240 [Clostridia bacterium]|nr:hypothetical protein [Clostridia bacterium]